MKKNSIDLNNVRPQCEGIRDEILRLEEKKKKIKPTYDKYNKRLMLNKEESIDKAELGHEIYAINIKIISKIQELAMCEEGRDFGDTV